MFAQAREGGVDLDALGDRMALRKGELLAMIKSQGLPPPVTRTFTGHKLLQGKTIDSKAA